mgnify:CR=1 FL=1|jgi:hypothetical protein
MRIRRFEEKATETEVVRMGWMALNTIQSVHARYAEAVARDISYTIWYELEQLSGWTALEIRTALRVEDPLMPEVTA